MCLLLGINGISLPAAPKHALYAQIKETAIHSSVSFSFREPPRLISKLKRK